MAKVSVNILNTNEIHCLPRCIESVLSQTYRDFEIVVIDNHSKDGSPEWVARHHPGIRLIRNESNLYYCEGHNVGIRAIDTDFVLLLNSDVFIEPDFLNYAMALIETDAAIGGVQGKLWKIFASDAEKPPISERYIDTTGVLVTRSRRNFDRYQERLDDGGFDVPGEVFGPDGSAPLYRRAMLEDIKIGDEYFDRDFLIYREIVDLSWRARSRGWTFLYEPRATGFHMRGFSPRTRSKQPLFFRKLSYRNRHLTLIKNETWRSFWPDMMKIIGFDMAMLAHTLIREPSLLGAWIDLVKLLPSALAKRKQIQKRRTISGERIRRLFADSAPGLHFQKSASRFLR